MSHLVDVNALEMARLAWTYARATDTHPVSFDAPDAASKIWLALCRHYQQRLYGNAGRHSFLRSSRELLFATIDQARRGGKRERDVAVIFVELFIALLVHDETYGPAYAHASVTPLLAATWATMRIVLTRPMGPTRPLPPRWLALVGDRVDLCALLEGVCDGELARTLAYFADAMEPTSNMRFVLRSDKLKCSLFIRFAQSVCAVCHPGQTDDDDARRFVSPEVTRYFSLLLCEDDDCGDEQIAIRNALARCVPLVDWSQSDDLFCRALLSTLALDILNFIDFIDNFDGMMAPIAQDFLTRLSLFCCYGDVLVNGTSCKRANRAWRKALRTTGMLEKPCSVEAIAYYKRHQS
jgi:hypothetical protein